MKIRRPCYHRFSVIDAINSDSTVADHIAWRIGDPQDILSFALTCKKIYALILPTHLQARLLSCDMRRLSVWDALARHPEVAAQYTSLRIFKEWHNSKPVIPTEILEPEYLNNGEVSEYWVADESSQTAYEEAMLDTIDQMSLLSKIQWSLPNPPGEHLLRIIRVSTVSLTTLSFELSSAYTWELYSPLFDFLILNCATIQSFSLKLLLEASSVPLIPFLARARWPSLERFTLVTPSCPLGPLESFLTRNRTVKYLELERLLDIRYPVGLKELYIWDSVKLGVEPEDDLNIEALFIHLEFAFDGAPAPYVKYLKYMKGLKRLVINSEVTLDTLIQIAQHVPQLQKLHAVLKLEKTAKNQKKINQLALLLPKLTHLGYVVPVNEGPNDEDDVVFDILDHFLSLKFVRVGPPAEEILAVDVMGAGRNHGWYTVLRSPEGATYFSAKDTIAGVSCRDWGIRSWAS